MVNLKRILAPTDCSELSSNAMEYALEMTKRFNAHLTVLKVFPNTIESPFGSAIPKKDISSKYQENFIKEIETFWKPFAQQEVNPDFLCLMGDPFSEIMRYVKDAAVDLIVMGTHGFTGLKHVFMGSVAEKTVRYSPAPVLTIRHKSFQFTESTDCEDSSKERY